MPRYALLLAPSANRVYADQAGRLSRSELAAFRPVLSSAVDDIDAATIGGVEYLTFDADLSARDVKLLPVTEAQVAAMRKTNRGYIKQTIPARLLRNWRCYGTVLLRDGEFADELRRSCTAPG